MRRGEKIKRSLSFALVGTIILSMLGVASSTAKAEESKLSLVNPGFEEAVVNDMVPGWTSMFKTGENYSFEVTTERSFSGTYSLKIEDLLSNQSVAVISDNIQAIPSAVYTAKTKIFIEAGTVASINLRFYDASGVQIAENPYHCDVKNGFPTNEWLEVSTSGIAPLNTKYVRILAYCTAYGQAKVYYDDMSLSYDPNPPKPSERLNSKYFGQPEYLTAPIDDTLGLFDGATGKEEGHDVMYTTVKGVPPVFHVIDLDNYKLLRSFELTGAGDTWSHTVAPNGTVYIAAGAQLWAYSPVTKTVEKLTTFGSESVLWAVETDENGYVYVSTFPGGKVFGYNPVTKEVKDFGRTISDGSLGTDSARSLAYYKGFVYVGTNRKKITRLNVSTFEQKDITEGIELLKNEKDTVYDVDEAGGYLFARYETTKNMYVYDLENQKWLDVVLPNVQGLHTSKALNNKVYMISDYILKYFDLETKTLETTGIEYATGLRGADWVELENDPDLPGISLCTMNFSGHVSLINLQDKIVKKYNNILPPSPSITGEIQRGSDGKIYICGMQASKGASYDIDSNSSTLFKMGQAGSIEFLNGKAYFGVYPSANVYEYDLTMPPSDENPKHLFEVGELQSRITSGTTGENKVFFGTIPEYGYLGGALVVYDPSADSTSASKVHRNVVQDQSIISLAYRDGKVYGATHVNGGLGSAATASEAKMFIWDVASSQKIAEFPLRIQGLYKPKGIGGLIFGPDGLLWGAANGFIFAMNPETQQIIKSKNLFPDNNGWGQWGSYKLQWSEDGFIYGYLGDKLAVVDPDSLDFKYMAKSTAFDIGKDGNIYYSPSENRTLLYRMKVKNLEIEQLELVNPGFEEDINNNIIPGWSNFNSVSGEGYKYEISSEQSFSGSKSLKVIDTIQGKAVTVQSDLIPVEPGVEYMGNAKIMLVNENLASLMVRFYDVNKKQVGTDSVIHNEATKGFAKNVWNDVKTPPQVAPPTAKYARIFAMCTSYGKGISYYDDMKIIYAKNDVTDPVTNAQVYGTKGLNDWYTSNVTLSLSASDDKTGVDTSEYTLDRGISWNSYTNEIELTESGIYSVIYRSVDRAGNKEIAKKMTLKIDKETPIFELIVNGTRVEQSCTVEDSVPTSIKLQVNDITSGIKKKLIRIDGEEISSETIDFAGKPGEHIVNIVVEDNAGNKTETNYTISVVVSTNSINTLIEQFAATGELSKALESQLSNNLSQAQHQFSKGDKEQAVKHIEDFTKHLKNPTKQDDISQRAARILSTDANYLIKLWLK